MTKVIFNGATKEQTQWGANTDPEGVLTIGETYEVDHQDVHSFHTKLYLVGIKGSFNSVCFSSADPTP